MMLGAGTTFAAVVFDWDGTAVPDREADASAVRERVERLCAASVHVFVVTGTHVGNIDGQLRARPRGPGTLHLCVNRGSEVFAVDERGPALAYRRDASGEENAALDRAAALMVSRLHEHGLEARVVSERLNRRKIDIIPEPEWADPPKAVIDQLLHAVTARLASAGISGLAAAVDMGLRAGRDAGLADPRVTSDAKHVEIGLTDKSHSARWAERWLADRGIGAGLVLIGGDEFATLGGTVGSDALMLVPELARALAFSVGVEPEGVPDGVEAVPGGPSAFLAVLDAQLARHTDRSVPWIDEDPAWTVALPADEKRERAADALGSLANGRCGLRGARAEDGSTASPLLVVDGIYTHDALPRHLRGPLPTTLEIDASLGRRTLDLRTGMLARVAGDHDEIRVVRFVSLARPPVIGLRAEGPHAQLQPGPDVVAPDGESYEHETDARVSFGRTIASTGGGIVVAASTTSSVSDGTRTVERMAAWVAHPRAAPSRALAASLLEQAEEAGFDALVAEHRGAWARRWQDAAVGIDGPAADQLAARFSIFHLLANAADTDETAVSARGLTGTGYGGHVFWDSEVFALPALAAINPPAARAMLEYRIRRLDAARAAARARGRDGARFPWESADEGNDVTPTFVRGPNDRIIPIRTGHSEDHISADVAWAACHYATWTGDDAFLAGPGGELVIETARYWASRVRITNDGTGHIYEVIGPDEYHAVVDDNAFTNVMARWNLRRGADLLAARGGNAEEIASWRHIADVIVDNYDPIARLYEQFAGYYRLEPLTMADVASPPIAADVVLGAKRVNGSQILKQSDVLMLHHLVPDEVEPDSLVPNLEFYGPRTAHGSSLSPAMQASLLARAGRADEALSFFRMAARLDLDDLTGTTSGGLHIATLGGVWQALAFGFAGLRVKGDRLHVDPALPSEWSGLTLRMRVRGAAVGVEARHDRVTIHCDRPVLVVGRDGVLHRCTPPATTVKTFPLPR